jgi:hypothetical protein
MSTIYDAALDSARFNSMNPERFAESVAREFDAHLDAVRSEFLAASPDAEKAGAEFEAYRAGYEQRFRAWLAARSRTASAMVTGPSKFPSRRNAKRLDTERRRSEELTEWSARARKVAVKHLTPPRDLVADTEKLERQLELMKAANAIVRRKVSDADKVAALMDLGLTEATARKVLEPDFCGRVGFPPHELSSIRGKLKRLRAA